MIERNSFELTGYLYLSAVLVSRFVDLAQGYCQIKSPCWTGVVGVACLGHGLVLSMPSRLPPARQSGTPKATQVPLT
jgi:hypothetical protein